MKKTKIICTIGPACDTQGKIQELIKNGLDAARLNLSYNTHNYHQQLIQKIRTSAKQLNKPISIIADLQGPKVRLGNFPEKVFIKSQSIVFLGSSYEQINNKSIKIPITYPNLYQYVQNKDKIFIGDHQIELEVQEVNNKEIKCLALNEGVIFANMGIGIPNTHLQVQIPTEKDIRDIKFSIENDVDFIALSFVSSDKDLIALKETIGRYQSKNQAIENPIKIIAKIEKLMAVENIDKIIRAADAIMIARGDLGTEVPVEKIPLIQKMIIQKCLKQAKPVIVATQMLSSMQDRSLPTRAEVSDIANAVIDQADALMLSEETSIGKYPIKSIKVMNKIIIQTEKFEDKQIDFRQILSSEKKEMGIDDSLIFSLNLIAQTTKAKLILVISLSGYTGRIISRFRLKVPLFVFTCREKIAKQLNLNWGLFPLDISDNNLCNTVEKIEKDTINDFLNKKILKKGDVILVIGRKDRQYLSSIDWIEIRHI